MKQEKEYYAFISYKREDEKWAKWLQDKLEHYRFPTNLNGRTDLPKNIRPTFRDVTDLNPGLLAEEINKALCSSEWLIVVCSPRSAKSPWVCKEAQNFIDHGRADHIIPFVIEGNPFSNDTTTECYPEALLNLTGSKELLAANINEMGRDAAAIKVVARMFNLRFDALWQRHEREQQKRRNIRRGILASIVLVVLLVTAWMIRSDWNMMKIQARAVAEKANTLIDEGDSYTARRILLEVTPKKWVWKYWPNRPYVSEVEVAFRRAYENSSAIMRSTDYVRQVCISPDGQTIITASDGGNVIFWNRRECIPIDTLKAHDRFVFIIEMDSKGTQLLTSNGHEIKIWDFETRKIKRVITPHRGSICTVSFSPDGKMIVTSALENSSGNYKYLICTWSTETGDSISTIRDSHYGEGWAEFCQDGKIVIGGDSCYQAKSPLEYMKIPGNIIRFWDAQSGEIKKSVNVKGNRGCYNYQKQQVVSIDGDSALIYNMSGSVLHVLKGHSKDITKAIYSPDGNEILTYSDDLTIRIWDAGTGDIKKVLKGHTYGLLDVKYSPDGKYVVSAAADNTIRLWDISTTAPQYVLNRNDGLGSDVHYRTNFFYQGKNLQDTVFCINQMIVLSPNGRYVAAPSTGGFVRIWNAKDGQFYEKLTSKTSNAPYLLAFDSQEKHLATFDSYSINIWNLESRSIKYERNIKRGYSYVEKIAFSPNSDRIAVVYNDSLVLVTNIENDVSDSINIDSPQNAIFSPDGAFLVIASDEITILDMVSKSITKVLEREERNPALSFSDNGQYLLFNDKWSIVVWDMKEGKEYKRLKYDNYIIRDIMMSPDNKYVWATGLDFVITWYLPTGVIVYQKQFENKYGEDIRFERLGVKNGFTGYEKHGGTMNSISICPRKNILSFSDGVDIMIWNIPSLQEIIDDTRERFKDRKFTPEERRWYYLE